MVTTEDSEHYFSLLIKDGLHEPIYTSTSRKINYTP